jgi:hypothetical protein
MKWSTFSNIAGCVAGAVASVVVGEVAVIPEVVVGVGYQLWKASVIETKVKVFRLDASSDNLRELREWSNKQGILGWTDDVFNGKMVQIINDVGLGAEYKEILCDEKVSEFRRHPSIYSLRELWAWVDSEIPGSVSGVFDDEMVQFLRLKGLYIEYLELEHNWVSNL